MYIPPYYSEPELEVQQKLIKAEALGTLITHLSDDTATLPLQANHIPFTLVTGPEHGEYGTLRAHMHRINPQAKQLIHASLSGEPDALVAFTHTQAYVPPKYYVKTKPTTGDVVPTWNFAVVHCYGKVKVFHEKDETTRAFLMDQLNQLVDEQEAIAGSTWKVNDASPAHLEKLLPKIIGIEIQITKQEGKFKMSQEQMDRQDKEGVIEGFAKDGNQEMSDCVKHACERRAERLAKR
ncbi:hypothetical protein CJU90_5441 [Yarrowia sp. C11]|nr:hypothetical protein CJU90_5441 [Yarrowia sp. C11]KAG5364035.1 hypothetical protein CKK34_2820 [Yarrowia sp. E02]